MRIGLSCTILEDSLTQGKIDGIGTYTKNFLEELAHQKISVVPVSFPNNNLTCSSFANGILFPKSYTKTMLHSLIQPLATGLNDKIDIFHATDHMIPKLKNIPIVATVHDAMMFKFPQWYFTSRLGLLKKWLRKKSFSWADKVITGAHAMIPELVEYCGIQEEKITVIPDGISSWWSERVSQEEKQQVLTKYHLPAQFILSVGTLQPKKNIPRLIEAYLKLPQDIKDAYPLVIVGRQSWDAEDSLQAIDTLKNAKTGHWLNYVELNDLRILFQCATLYVHPSLHEGFGLTLLQAFASGTPVLTANVTAMPETAGEAAILIDPYSIDDIQQGLFNCLTNPILLNNLIQKGLVRVKEFSWERCVKRTIEVYKII